MSKEKMINVRLQQKHDLEKNWNKASNFIPKVGEIIVYDADEIYSYPRIKIGDGIKFVNDLSFANDLNTLNILHNDLILSDLINSYILNIDYDAILAFDTSEVIFGTNTTSVLGQAILGQMILA